MEDQHQFRVEFLPPYSPFLAIIEEFFRDIKMGIFRKNTQAGGRIDNSKVAAKDSLLK